MDEPAELDRVILLDEVPEPNIQPPPRVWPVFVVYLLTFGALILCQLGALSFLFIWLIAHGANPEQLQTQLHALLLTPLVFLVLGSLNQIVVACGASIPARLSPVQTRQRLGFLPSGLSVIGYAVVLAGLAFPILLATGIEFFLNRFGGLSDPFRPLLEQMTWPIAVVFTLFATLEPSVVEEMFFRGYMQRRFLERWPPWAAILITSLLFALFHFNLWQGLSVLPYSLWVGYLAWRLDSIWVQLLLQHSVLGRPLYV